MNRNAICLVTVLALILLAAAFACSAGCGGPETYTGENGDSGSLIVEASDQSVIDLWDGYEILRSVPHYTGGGIYDVSTETETGGVNFYYAMTSESDFTAYASKLSSSGFKLKDGSSVWAAEGSVGAPVYIKGDIELKVIWTYDGMLAVCAERP